MTGRHTRTPVWLTRLRAPFATTSAHTLPEFDLDPNPLTAEHVGAWRNRVAGGLWLATIDGSQRLGAPRRTQEEALDHLAPRVRVAKATSPARNLLQRVRGIRFTRPDSFTGSVLRPPSERIERAAFAAVFVLLGAVVGYGGHAIALQAPQDCGRAFTLADRTFVDYENVTTAVVMMSTRGQSEYEGHEADAIQLWDDIDAAKADYRDAKAACLGGVR